MKSVKANLKVRNSAFELLRIVAIIFIILSHYNFYGVIGSTTSNSTNIIVAYNFILGDIGVAMFMMISGFFLRKSERINVWHIVKLLLEYYFYSFLGYGLSFALMEKSFNAEELLHASLGLFYEQMWFVSAYLLVYLFHPFINKLFKEDNFKSASIFLLLITVVWSIIPSITAGTFYLNRFLSVFCLYCYGAYLNLAKEMNRKWYTKKVALIMLLSGGGFIVIYQVIMSVISISHPDMAYMINWFTSRHALPMIVMVSGVMMLTSIAKPFYSRIVNYLSSFTLGIYLIHENEFLKDYFWHKLFRVQDYANSNNLYWSVIMAVAIIFFGCIAIDMVRRYAFEMPLFSLLHKLFTKKDNKVVSA